MQQAAQLYGHTPYAVTRGPIYKVPGLKLYYCLVNTYRLWNVRSSIFILHWALQIKQLALFIALTQEC